MSVNDGNGGCDQAAPAANGQGIKTYAESIAALTAWLGTYPVFTYEKKSEIRTVSENEIEIVDTK
jgi:hypothetical protein